MRSRNTTSAANRVLPPYHERVSTKHSHDFITPADDDFMPADLTEATAYVLDQQPAEVASYAGSPDVQLSAAADIAQTIFRYGVPIGENYQNWRQGQPLREPAAPLEDTLSPAEALAAKLARTTYRPYITAAD